MNVVIDTNVIVSAFINTNGVPAKILSLVLNGNLKILYDNRILFEYLEVLSRKDFGFPADIINDMIDFIRHEGEFVNSGHLKLDFSDEKDKKFYEVFKFGKAQYLITGNIKHFPKESVIVLPKDFLLRYEFSEQ